MTEAITSSEEVLKDANMVETPGQPDASQTPDTTAAPASPAPLEIGSLGEAMQAFNKAKSKAAEPDVPEGGAPDEGTKPGASDSGANEAVDAGGKNELPDGAPIAEAPTDTQVQPGEVPGEPGGYAGDDEVYDADAGVAEVKQQLVAIAVDAVRKDFAKKNIKKITINDLMKTDEKAGTREFINPDTGRPFSSSNPRSEAQNFVKDYNADLDAQFAAECQKLMPDIERSYAPVIKFHQFLPKWQAMDEFRQNMFENLVEGHELRDAQGNIVAYNIDLDAVHDQMERQIQWLIQQQQSLSTAAAPAAEENPVTQPAVAAKTVKQKVVGEEQFDLSNMEDALKYYNKKKGKKQ